MGLGPGAMGHGDPLYPMAQQWVQGLPVIHTLPSSTKKPLEASYNDMVVIKDSVPAASPPWLHHMAEPRQSPKVSFGGVAEPMRGYPMHRKACIAQGWAGFDCFFSSSDHPGGHGPGPARAGDRRLHRGLF